MTTPDDSDLDARAQPDEVDATEAAESLYRCAECGDGKHLWAYWGANVCGPVGADGQIEYYEDIDEWGIHEDSIQCTVHPGDVIEQFVNGQWCRWWSCPNCKGHGRTHIGENWRAQAGYECREGIELPGKYGPYRIHEGWRPLSEFATEAAK